MVVTMDCSETIFWANARRLLLLLLAARRAHAAEGEEEMEKEDLFTGTTAVCQSVTLAYAIKLPIT